MEQVFIVSFLVTFLFCVVKFLEAKYLDKQWKPLKFFVRDAIIVFSSAIVASIMFFYNQGVISDFFNVVTETTALNSSTTQVFTDTPEF